MNQDQLALTIVCPLCAAGAGERCLRRGKSFIPLRIKTVHRERILKAREKHQLKCKGCGAKVGGRHGRAWALLWDGALWRMYGYISEMMHGPYCTACVSPELGKRNAGYQEVRCTGCGYTWVLPEHARSVENALCSVCKGGRQ